MADVKLPPGTKVYLGDVKNMYTNIDHVNLNEVIRWVLNLARKNLGHDLSILVPNAKSKRPCGVSTFIYPGCARLADPVV